MNSSQFLSAKKIVGIIILRKKNPFKEPFVQYKFPWMFSVLHETIYANKEPSVGSIMLRILPDFLF